MNRRNRLGMQHPVRRHQLSAWGDNYYNATSSSPHRRSPAVTIKNLDLVLNRRKRKIGSATALEQMTNSALLAWTIRKHLDYVSRFEINFRSGEKELDNEVKSLLDWHGRKSNFDIGSRHSRNQWMRIFEMNKIFNGDAIGIKIAGSGKLQGLDSSQVNRPDDWGTKKPPQKTQEKVTQHGLILGKYGEVNEYCICTRNDNNRLVFDHFEAADNVLFDGYFLGFNQTRGHSPLLSAINDSIDLDDIRLYTKINLKLKNIFGVAVFRDTADPLGNQSDYTDSTDTETEEIKTQLSPDQINIFDLDREDKAQFLETNSPGANSMEFMDKLARIVLLSLDIPYTSFDSSKASFSARIGDRAEYEESAQYKRDKNAQIIREVYAWRISDWYKNNTQFREIADKAGFDAGRIIRGLDIIPAGTPWLDKLNEVKGDILSVSLGLESIPRLARKRGVDAYEIMKEQAKYLKDAKDEGVPVFYASGGQEAVQNILTEPANQNQNGDGQNGQQ
ncbi:MAG: phage portal protein [Victivallaceae bacterium]|nr:phage portal protein [Victivallaceae bacterium]